MNNTGRILLIAGLLCLGTGIGTLSFYFWQESSEREIESAYTSLREGEEYLRQNSSEAAKQASVIFNKVLALNLNNNLNQYAKYGLAVALEKMDDRAAALELYRELYEDALQDPELRDKVLYSLGKLYLYINHEEEGRSLLNSLLVGTRDARLKSKIHSAFGNYYLFKGDRKKAEENFKIALKYFPENLHAEESRAEAVRRQGKPWAAYEYYDSYLKGTANLDPVKKKKLIKKLNQDIYNSGIRAFRTGKYNEAIAFLTRTSRDNPESRVRENSLYWMAESYAALGKESQALNYYNRVLKNENASKDQPALIKKGIIYYKRGKMENAASFFHRAIYDFPGGPFTEQALEWRREIQSQLHEFNEIEEWEYERDALRYRKDYRGRENPDSDHPYDHRYREPEYDTID